MVEQKHTPGYLRLSDAYPLVNTTSGIDLRIDKKYIARINAYEFYGCTIEEANANAERVVACWNFCMGTPTQDLKRGGLERLKLKLISSERYELLAALKGIIDNTTVEFAAANGFGEERNKVCEVYDRIMLGTPNAGGAQ